MSIGDYQIGLYDKVIQTINERRVGYPGGEKYQLSNGQLGLVQSTVKGFANVLFAGVEQKVSFGYKSQGQIESDDSNLELAYAITVHKSQGSDFDYVFLIIPKTGRVISRELIYTALTRAKKKLVLLVEGDDPHWIINLSKPQYSETAKRNTHLFRPSVREIESSIPYAEGLIHKTRKEGLLVRSKSEVIIANMLIDKKIDFEYERQYTGKSGQKRIPDFTFIDAAGDLIFMAEYINVEKPFLDKLHQLGWQVFDQGIGVPQEPKKSLRENFKQVLLPKVFKDSIKAINKTVDGKEWLTDKQLDEILFEIQNFAGKSLHEANKEIHRLLLKGTSVSRNELTGEQDPTVRLVDFKNYNNNSFIAINQFRLLTPGASRQGIIPDIVLFLNGLPVVVVEAKDFDVAEPLSEAYLQVTRYANTRDDDYGLKEGEEKLFHYNIFSIITHGREARVGTISAEFDFYNNWVDIFPEEYKVVQFPPDEERQEVLIHGMLNKEILG